MTETSNPEKYPKLEKVVSYADTLQKQIERFLAKSDEPGPILSEKEEFELSKRAGHDPEALKQWNRQKLETKYRRNALSAPLMSADLFLTSDESKNIPEKERGELLERVNAAKEHITAVKGNPFKESDVRIVIDLVNDLKKYL